MYLLVSIERKKSQCVALLLLSTGDGSKGVQRAISDKPHFSRANIARHGVESAARVVACSELAVRELIIFKDEQFAINCPEFHQAENARSDHQFDDVIARLLEPPLSFC